MDLNNDKPIILLYGDNAKSLSELFENEYEVKFIESFDVFKDDGCCAQIMFIDEDIISLNNFKNYTVLRKHSYYLYLPIVVVGKHFSSEKKIELIKRDIQYVLDLENVNDKLLHRIEKILKHSNPHTGTKRDIFVKSFIKYEQLSNTSSSYLYLANYLIYHLNIDSKVAADVRLTILLLMIGYEKEKMQSLKRFIKDMQIFNNIVACMNNYENPKRVEEALVFCAIAANLHEIDTKSTLEKMSEGAFEYVYDAALQAVNSSTIVVQKGNDIDVLWERISEILFLDEKFVLREDTQNCLALYQCFLELFVLFGSMKVEFYHVEDFGYRVSLELLEVESLSSEDISMVMQSVGSNLEMEYKDLFFEIALAYCTESYAQEKRDESSEKLVHQEKINTMHYIDAQKINAVEFVEERGVDYELLDDLNEYSQECLNTLEMSDGLNDVMLAALQKAYELFSKVFYTSLEFEDLGYTLRTLSQLVSGMDIANYNELQLKSMKTYFIGIIHDLNDWKEHIYLLQDAPDIHYLDASLLENCAQIEKMIQMQEDDDDDDDDLEFF